MLFKGDQRNRRMPHLRGGGKGRAQPGDSVRIPRERRDGDRYQQRKGAGGPPHQSGAAAFHARSELPFLRAQHRLRAAKTVPRLRCKRQALCGRARAVRDRRFRAAHDP